MADSAYLVDEQNPWPGLSPFTESSQNYFFGRENEIREILSRIEARPFMLLFGQSGLGKTSLLQAGLMPRLRKKNYLPVYFRLDFDPSAPGIDEQTSRAILRALAAIGAPVPEHRPGADPNEGLWEWLHRSDTRLKDAGGHVLTPILILDQFEEIFTLGERDAATRARSLAWFQCLAFLVENWCPAEVRQRMEEHEELLEKLDLASQPVRILLSMREDFLPHLDEREEQMPSMMLNRLRLTPLRGTEALEAVLKPAPRLITRSVAETIVRFVAGEPQAALPDIVIATPILNLVCRELNERRKARNLSVITPDLIEGDAGKILRQFYEECLKGQPLKLRIFIEEELLSTSGHRENISEERANRIMARDGLSKVALEDLVARRLLQKEERLGRYRFELIHDVLCGPIGQSRAERAVREKEEKDEEEKKAVLAKMRRIRRNLTLAGAGFLVLLVLLGIAIWEAYQSHQRSQQLSHLITMMSDNNQHLVDNSSAYPEFKPIALDVFKQDLPEIDQVIQEGGGNKDVLWLKFSTLYFLADLVSADKDRKKKLEYTQQAMSMADQLIRSDKDLEDQSRIGILLGLLSECFFEVHEDALGKKAFDEGGRLLDDVSRRNAAVGHNAKAVLTSTFYDSRQSFLSPAERDTLLQQCVAEAQQAYDAENDNVRYGNNLAHMLRNRASFLMDYHPDSPELGGILKQIHDLEDKLRLLIDKLDDQDIVSYRDDASDVYKTKAEIEQEEGKWDDAEDSYLSYINTRLSELPDDPSKMGKFYNYNAQQNLAATAYNDAGDFERAKAKAAARDIYKRDSALNEAENAYNASLKFGTEITTAEPKEAAYWTTLGNAYLGLEELAVQRANIALDAQPSDAASAETSFQEAERQVNDNIGALQRASDMADPDDKSERARSVAIAQREKGSFELDWASAISKDAPDCYKKALDCFNASEALLSSLLKDFPGDTGLELSSALALSDLSSLAKEEAVAASKGGRMDEARQRYREAEQKALGYIAALTQLCAQQHAAKQDDSGNQSDLVYAYSDYGDLLRSEARRLQPAPPGLLDQATKQYGKAMDLANDLTKQYSTAALAWTTLADVYDAEEECAKEKGLAALDHNDVARAKPLFLEANEDVAEELKAARQALKLATGAERQDKKEKVAAALGAASYSLLFTGQYALALKDADDGIWEDPTQEWITTNQAHALLLQGDFDDAWTIYQQHAFERIFTDGPQMFAAAVQDDFAAFKRAHAFFNARQLADMEKIGSQLHELPPPAPPSAPSSN